MKILAADYVLPIAAAPIERGAVAYAGDRIVEVGPAAELAAKYPDAATEDFGEAAILPGFVNAHAHLEITAMRGFLDTVEHDFAKWLLKLTKTRAERLSDEDVSLAAQAGALEGARAGVTCFADVGRFGRAGFEALKRAGLRGVLFQETEFSPDDRTAREDFRRLEEKFLALRETETPLVKAGLSPHSPYTVSRALFEKIGEYALEKEVKLTIHAAESEEEHDLLMNGRGFFVSVYEKYDCRWDAPHCSPIEFLARTGVLRARPLLAHCVRVSEIDLDIIGETDARVAHCPKSNAKFGHGAAPLERFLDRSIKTGFGSDSVASNNLCDLLEEARFGALTARNRPGRKRFLEAEELLRAVTLGGAEALGLDAEIGTLEAGKQADLAIVALESIAQKPLHDVYAALVFASSARDVRLTIVAGEEICRDGEPKKLDEREIKAKLKEIKRKMN